ncbi:MAG: DNA-binding transcriptional regulator Fis [Pseudomonadota bacterium]
MMSTLLNPISAPTLAETQQDYTLRESVQRALTNYFTQLGEQHPTNLFWMVLDEIEAPLMEAVMAFTRGNQSRAAILLGISRGTLRKKLKKHKLD